jgi:CBS domain-containing protein
VDENTSFEPKLVRDLMSVGVFTCALDTPVTDLARAFFEKDQEAAVVLDENGHGAGVVGQKEIIQAFARECYKKATAEMVMEPGVPQLPPDIPLAAAAQLMLDRGLRVFFMTHHAGGIEYPAAYIGYRHLLRLVAMQDPGEISDLGINASRTAPLEKFFERRDAARRQAEPNK